MLGVTPDPILASNLQFVSSLMIVFEIIGHDWFVHLARRLMGWRDDLFSILHRYSVLSFIGVILILLATGVLYALYLGTLRLIGQFEYSGLWFADLFNGTDTAHTVPFEEVETPDLPDVIHGRATWGEYFSRGMSTTWTRVWSWLKPVLWFLGITLLVLQVFSMLLALLLGEAGLKKLEERTPRVLRRLNVAMGKGTSALDSFVKTTLDVDVVAGTDKQVGLSWFRRVALLPLLPVSLFFFAIVGLTWLVGQRQVVLWASVYLLSCAQVLSR